MERLRPLAIGALDGLLVGVGLDAERSIRGFETHRIGCSDARITGTTPTPGTAGIAAGSPSGPAGLSSGPPAEGGRTVAARSLAGPPLALALACGGP